MRHFLLSVFLFFFLNYSFCQNIGWQEIRIDSFLTVSLPDNVIKSDTTLVRNNMTYKTKTFKVSTEFAILAVTVMQTELNINPYQLESEQMKQSYEGVKYGFRKKAEDQGFSLDMKDTVVNAVPGFKANIFTDDHKVVLNRMSYYFCVNSLTYLIQAVPLKSKVSECAENMKQLMNSIQFNKKEILAHASNDSSNSLFDKSEKIGKLLAPILLMAGISFFFFYRNKKKSKSSSR